MKRLLSILLVLISATPAYAATVSKVRHRRMPLLVRLRHPRWQPTFPPSPESLYRQNAEIDRLGLARIADAQELQSLINKGDLVPLPLGPGLKADPRLPEDRRYCRPWTAQFLTDLSTEFYKEFHQPLQVNSAVRTVSFQKKLARRNRNAAPPEGAKASSHLAGLTVDLQRKHLTKTQVAWLKVRLIRLRALGLVEVEEEYYQFCFHIMVSGRYGQELVPTVTANIPAETPTSQLE